MGLLSRNCTGAQVIQSGWVGRPAILTVAFRVTAWTLLTPVGLVSEAAMPP